MRTLIFCTAVLIASAGSAAAQTPASTTLDAPTVTVSYADLNLDNPVGMDALRSRIQTAARQVCGDRSRLLALESRRAVCVTQARDGAFRDLAAFRSMHASRRGVVTVAALAPIR